MTETARPIREIAFVFVHEMQHQILHTVPIMQALADQATAQEGQGKGAGVRIRAFVRGTANMAFAQSFLTDAARARIEFTADNPLLIAEGLERAFGRSVPFSRYGFLLRIARHLRTSDIIVSPETTSLILKRLPWTRRAKFVFVPHGAGDRAVSFEPSIRRFDKIFLPGEKTKLRMLEEGVLSEGQGEVIGYPKFLAIRQQAMTGESLFGNSNPVFLYNPHFDPYLSSWYDMGTDVLESFLARPELNLVVAPHVMTYRRQVQISKEHGRIRNVPKIDSRFRDAPNIHVDTGSQASVDMSYTRLADVYIGDVSSQVYEFIHAPRPVVYLNPNGHDWAVNPYFKSWSFGTILEDKPALDDYLDQRRYEANPDTQAQREAFTQTFGESIEAAADNAASALTQMSLAPTQATEKDRTKQQASHIFKNFGKLASGKVIAAVLSLAYLAIAARSLGPEGMGYLVLAHAYVLIIAQIARFQSWQAIIRFGDPLLAEGKISRFKALIRFTVNLDLLSAVLAVAISLLFLGPVARAMEWPDDVLPIIKLYCLAGPFLFAATPTGLLQLQDRFGTLSWQQLILPGTRFVGALGLWFWGGTLEGFLIVWVVSAVLHGSSLWVLGWYALKQHKLLPRWIKPDQAERGVTQGWWPFVVKTNLSSSIELTHSHLPLLIVGAVLGGAASGFLQLAINLTNLIAHPANLLNEATFPQLSKINTGEGRRRMRAVALRSMITGMLVALPIVLAYSFWRNDLATLVGGAAFLPAGVIIAWMAAAQLTRIASVVLESAILAVDGAGFVLAAQCIAAVIIVGGLALMLPRYGAVGAPIALLVAMAATAVLYLMRLNAPLKSAAR